MALRKGSKVEGGYATITEDEGVNYREISEVMTEMGWAMNHSSARNYVLRAMAKFAAAYGQHMGCPPGDPMEMARSPQFQSFISDMLHRLEAQRRTP
ncbi:MAG: hypothetical protein EBT03_07445 [Betaproteobacteria bacterium]|nr:hypothetical protein [Betaproteobacteria bacterium]NCA17006.1 hypothetical protein [Betaproteobacteria bacterium]